MVIMAFHAANNAGRQAQSHAYFAQRNARFIDPWKVAAGKIAEARLAGTTGGWTPGGTHRPPLGRLQTNLLQRIAKRTVGTSRKPGPAQAREDTRYHLPQEYQPQFIEDQQQADRAQTQPFDREVPHSPWGNLSRTQFLGDEPGTP